MKQRDANVSNLIVALPLPEPEVIETLLLHKARSQNNGHALLASSML
jgi:hypothetical protein